MAVIGAGTGGLYFAMRLIEAGKVNGSDVCIFESTDRVGGRIYSLRGLGPKKDLSVDAGGASRRVAGRLHYIQKNHNLKKKTSQTELHTNAVTIFDSFFFLPSPTCIGFSDSLLALNMAFLCCSSICASIF